MKYTIIMERGSDRGWGAYCPDLPGLVLAGDSREDLLASARDGIETYLDAIREAGLPFPTPRTEATIVDIPDQAA